MMAIAPQKGNNRTKVGFFAKTAFGCCCFFTLISVILLFAFKNKAKRAMLPFPSDRSGRKSQWAGVPEPGN